VDPGLRPCPACSDPVSVELRTCPECDQDIPAGTGKLDRSIQGNWKGLLQLVGLGVALYFGLWGFLALIGLAAAYG
jgi:hypothetical protein